MVTTPSRRLVRVLAALIGLTLAAGAIRVATYEEVPPAPAAINLWGALLTSRSATVAVTGDAIEARGVIEFAAQRSSLAVTTPVPYAEVADRAVTYVRRAGRWYRYVGAQGPSGVAFALVRMLSEADPLRYEGRAAGRTRWSAPNGLRVVVDARGFPVVLERGTTRAELSGFFGPGADPPPLRSTPVASLDAALRAGA